MKKVLSLLFIIPLFAVILTACGNDDNKSKMGKSLLTRQYTHFNLLQNK